MSRLVDPTICPDCRAPLDTSATCTGCGLRVQGPLAVQLWGVMSRADQLVERLRAAAPQEVAAPRGETGTALVMSAAQPTEEVRASRSRRLPAASVQAVLLGLGALCLLVAAVVFVAVAWSVMGLTGRTLVLLGVTTVLAGVAAAVTRRSLRWAAETLWLVVAAMLALDLLAAESAGLAGLDALSWRQTAAMVGIALVGLGAGVGAWARRLEVGRLLGAEGVAVVGAAVVCASNAWGASNPAVGTTVAVPVLVVGALLLRRHIPLTAYGWAGLAVASWLVLLGAGLDRAAEPATYTAWWSDLRGWPLLAASVLAATPTPLRRLPPPGRALAAGLALLPLAVLAIAPQTPGGDTRVLLAGAATVVVLGLVTALATPAWARGAAVLTTLGVLVLGVRLLAGPWPALADLVTDGGAPLELTMSGRVVGPAAWTAGIAALAAVIASGCLLRLVPVARRTTAIRIVGTLAPVVIALGGLGIVLGLQPPLWAGTLAAALATAIAGGAAWWSRDHLVPAGLAGSATAYLAGVTLYAASAADLLLALVSTSFFVALAVAAWLREGVGARSSAALTGSLAALAGGAALLAWGQVMSADTEAEALVLAAYAGLVGVLAALVTRQVSTRVSLEVTAIVLALVATGYSGDLPTVAVVLTIVGSAITLVTVTNRDRDLLGWLAAGVLGVATLLRVQEAVSAPEIYTLPAAVLLVLVGAWRLRVEADAGSLRMLGSGLTLALLPSLLLALEEPVSLRGALIGVGAVLVLAAGVQQRLAAPFVLGGLATGVLALRHLEPVADAVPRWASLGALGVALLVVGITWESRRRNLATAQQYLTALR